MEPKDFKFKIEVQFSKNRHYPEYGVNAFCIENYSKYFPYGKDYRFKSSKKAIEFLKNAINSKVLENYDRIAIINRRGYGGTVEYLKELTTRSDSNPIDKSIADKALEILW